MTIAIKSEEMSENAFLQQNQKQKADPQYNPTSVKHKAGVENLIKLSSKTIQGTRDISINQEVPKHHSSV